MQHQPNYYKCILLVVTLLVLLGIATPVLADFLGPNRTVTTTISVCHTVLYECKEVNGRWKYKRMEDWSCPNAGDACQGYDNSPHPCDEEHQTKHEYCTKEESTETITITYDPATIEGSIQNCNLQNGWCNGATTPELVLNAREPLSPDHQILLIEGMLNGLTFACSVGVSSCNIPLAEGDNTFSYWALSSWGDSSDKGTTTVKVDTIPPTVALPHAWQIGRNVDYSVSDEGSGIATLRVVIEDEDEHYKIAWDEESAKGTYYEQDINWDGKFKDKTVAPPGTYLVWVKASDWAGNETFQLGKVIVPEPNYVGTIVLTTEMPSVVPPVPPAALSVPTEAASLSAPQAVAATEATNGMSTQALALSNATGSAGRPSSAATTSSGILWGAAAAGVIGAATAYALNVTRQREESEAQQAARVANELKRSEEKRDKKKQKQQDNWNKQQASKQAQRQPINIDLKIARMEAAEGAKIKLDKLKQSFYKTIRTTMVQNWRAEKKDGVVQEKINAYTAKPQEWKAAYTAYMTQKAAEEKKKRQEALAQKNKPWWQKAWDGIKNTTDNVVGWVDQHQTEIAIGIGIIAGVAAVVFTAGMAAPAVFALGAILMAGGIVAAGTVGLNTYYGRPLTSNLLKNMSIAVGTAAITALAGMVLTKGVFVLGNNAARYCAANPPACAKVGVALGALDTMEEFGLTVKGAFQRWTGNDVGAIETAIELQMELMDGGMPGNSVAKELGGEAMEEIARYGDDAVDLVALYGVDAARIITKYDQDGIDILIKYGDDAIDLIDDHGPRAVEVMKVVDPEHAKDLLEKLDASVLDYVVEQGSGAVDALSRWSADDLKAHGVELALRAKKDADVLAAVRELIKLGPINPKRITPKQQEFIDIIVENSTYYGDEGQALIGKWVNYRSGFKQVARDTASFHYSPHPDVWDMLGELGNNQEKAAWLLNQKVIRNGIDKELPFEYSLSGIPSKDIDNEKKAIEAMFAGATDMEITDVLESDYMPIRMKELRELQKAGYKVVFDEEAKSYILALP